MWVLFSSPPAIVLLLQRVVTVAKTSHARPRGSRGNLGIIVANVAWQEAQDCESRPMNRGPERHGGPRPVPRTATPAHLTSDLRTEGKRLASCHEIRSGLRIDCPEPYYSKGPRPRRTLECHMRRCVQREVMPRMMSISTTTSRISGLSNEGRRLWVCGGTIVSDSPASSSQTDI